MGNVAHEMTIVAEQFERGAQPPLSTPMAGGNVVISLPIRYEFVLFRWIDKRPGLCSVPFRTSRIPLIDVENRDV
jgi:hypothetical protein